MSNTGYVTYIFVDGAVIQIDLKQKRMVQKAFETFAFFMDFSSKNSHLPLFFLLGKQPKFIR